MKHIIVPALAATLLAGSLAFADPLQFTFDDSGFDYEAREDAAPAYVRLARDAGGLRLTLTQDASGTLLPVVSVEEVPDLHRVDASGDDLLATVDDLAEIELLRSGASVRGFALTHDDADFRAAVASYVTAIEDLGFAASIVDSTSNLRIYTFQDDDAQLRAVFRRAGDEVSVYLESL